MQTEMKQKKIFLIHATSVSIEPINNAFKTLWPAARVVNLLEDSLSADLVAMGGQTPELMERFLALSRYGVSCGADAILFNCSSFSASIDYCRQHVGIPIFKPNEAMVEAALNMTSKIGLLATFEPAVASIYPEFVAYAEHLGKPLDFKSVVCPKALEALHAGDLAEHDRLLAEAAISLLDSDVICFAQFSMSSAAEVVGHKSGRPVLTTPESAVARIRHELGGD